MSKAIEYVETPAALALVKEMTRGVDYGYKPLRVLFIGKHIALVLVPGSHCWSGIGMPPSWHPTTVMLRGLLSEKSPWPSGGFPREHPASEQTVFDGGGRITQRKVDRLVEVAEAYDRDYPTLLKRWKQEND